MSWTASLTSAVSATLRFYAIDRCAVRVRPMLRSMVIWPLGKWIKHHRTQARDIAVVARHERQAID